MVETEESIYNLIPREAEVVVKPPLHQSKFKETSKETITNNPKKKPHATMGPLKVEKKAPTEFVKKHSNDFDKSKPVPKFTRQPQSPTQQVKTKQPVPKRTEKPVMGQKTQKDFVKTNVLEATTLTPPKPKEEVDYLKKPDFGQVPEYLHGVKDAIAEEIKQMEEMKLREKGQDTTRELTKKEKEDILAGLRANLKELDEEYRRLPVTLNTFGQKNKKEALEKRMAEIEKDIERISKEHVFVQE